MESIDELRKICQSTAKKDKSNVYMRYVSRFFSIYLTRFLLPTSVTANQVSVVMIAAGFVACLFFLSPSNILFGVGAFLLQIWYIIDCMDGEVARYRHFQRTGSVIMDKRQSSLTGLYYDMINHYIVNFLVPSTIGFGLFCKTGHSFWILLGLLGALSQVLMLAMHDAKCRAILAHLKKYSRIEPLSKSSEAIDEKAPDRSFAHKIFSVLHYLMTYPSVMNLVGGAALLNLFVPEADWRFPLLVFVGLGTTVVSSVLIGRTLRLGLVDQELHDSFTLMDATKETPVKIS